MSTHSDARARRRTERGTSATVAAMSRRDAWQQVIERFKPEERGAPASWRAERPRSPIAEIERRLDTPSADPHVLLTGTMGTGKTTELHHLATERADREFVVLIDLARVLSSEGIGHAEALHRIDAWEVCFLAGVALYRAAREQLGFAFPESHVTALRDAWTALQPAAARPEIDLAKLAQGIALSASTALPLVAPGAGVAPRVALATLPNLLGAGKYVLSWGRKRAPLEEPEPMEAMQTLLAAVNALIGDVQHAHRRVLLVLDGLDRIRDIQRARALFVESDLLARLVCPVVVCGPFALRHHPSVAAVPGFRSSWLVNAPVLDQQDPTREGPGVDFLVDVYGRRVVDLPAGLLTDASLRRLAYYSGGRVREFVRLVGIVGERAWYDDVDAATTTHVDEALDERRRELEAGLTAEHEKVLRGVMVDPKHRLPRHDLIWEMLTSGQLLPYPDGSEWYYPHPLLTLGFLAS
jgi:AAA ATPase domain